MTAGQAALAFVSLLVIVDPIVLAPVFAALTGGMDAARKRAVARNATLAGFALIGLAGVTGHAALRLLGAETAPVQVLIAAALAVMGLAMLLGKAGVGAPGGAPRRDPSLFPLAVPLIAGPGAIGAMVMLTGKHAGQTGALVTLYALLGAVAALTYAALRAAEPIAARLGPRGALRITRILGAVLLAAAARFLFEAARASGWLDTAGAPG